MSDDRKVIHLSLAGTTDVAYFTNPLPTAVRIQAAKLTPVAGSADAVLALTKSPAGTEVTVGSYDATATALVAETAADMTLVDGSAPDIDPGETVKIEKTAGTYSGYLTLYIEPRRA